jgi:hypothetical protein
MRDSSVNKATALIPILILISILLSAGNTLASGISVDAGLTPAEGRWIFRTQIRYMNRNDDANVSNRKMESYVFPFVLAYGLKNNLMFLARLPVQHRVSSMADVTESHTGLGDFFVLSKYKIYRRNTPKHVFGVAATLGFEMPTGTDTFTSGTWDLEPGLYCSWRRNRLGSDFSVAYKWNGFADDGPGGANPGDEVALDWAIAYQFIVGQEANTSLAPVLEASYRNILPDRISTSDIENTGESVMYLSPGIKFTRSSLILEGLAQIPVSQNQKGDQLEQGMRGLLGLRYMF